MLLSELLTPERIKIPLDSLDKSGILWEMSSLLARVSGVPEREEEIHQAVLEREAVLSTGIGGQVAIPHGKSPVLDSLVLVAGTTREPVEFEALDDRPVRLVLMLVGPASAAGLHVKTLSRISRLLRHEAFRQELIDAGDPQAFLRLLRESDTA